MGDLPTHIGSYRVLGKLGEGGMGVVYEAVHETDESRVAIKILHPEYAKSEEFTGRFFNEARAINRVSHPGLVQVSDFGSLSDGTAYIVMELLKGEALSVRLKQAGGALPIADVLRLGKLIADSLAAAHEKGIVHRDLKPENVMIVGDSGVLGGERTKLLDFGIAKLSDAKDFVKTRTNTMMGTPVYMSPEQCRGAGKVDDRADVYSFGVLLFVMVAGQPPFSGEGLGDIMGKHMYEAPPQLEDFAESVPAQLAELVAILLAKDKQQRPAMQAVVAELEAMAQDLPKLPLKARGSGAMAKAMGTGASIGSTLGTLAGQAQATEIGVRPPTALKRIAMGLSALLVLLVPALIVIPKLLLRKPAPLPNPVVTPAIATPAPSTPVRPVRWKIASVPPGASVIKESDGSLLCQTPCVHEQTPDKGLRQLRLRKDGFVDRVFQVDGASDMERSETLDPARRLFKNKKFGKATGVEIPPPHPSETPKPISAPKPGNARPKIED